MPILRIHYTPEQELSFRDNMKSLWKFPRFLGISMALVLAGCNLFQDADSEIWEGYATDRKSGIFGRVSVVGESHRDCIEKLKFEIVDKPQETWTEPFGCNYSGGSYWRVWFKNSMWGNWHFRCIGKHYGSEMQKVTGLGYFPVLKNEPARTETYYCV